jgi:segregation and condensation protein B
VSEKPEENESGPGKDPSPEEGPPAPKDEPGAEGAPRPRERAGAPEPIPAGAFLAGEGEGEAAPPPGSAPNAPAPPGEAAPPAPISDEEVAADLAAGAPSAPAAPAGGAAPEAAETAAEAEKPVPPPPPGKGAVEALLFAAETPLAAAQIAAFLGKGVKAQDAKAWLEELQEDYERSGRAFRMEEIGGGFRLMTRPEYFSYVRNLKAHERSSRLTEASLDTLAVIAYRQPILKADVNQIRGVESGPILKTLMEKGLIRAVGRAEALGRPILYGTTKAFLDFLGLKSLKDLPKPEK